MYSFSEVEVEIPSSIDKRYRKLNLFTDIQVFEENKLTYQQSSLNMPLNIIDIYSMGYDVKRVSFQYVVSDTPTFIHKVKS